MREIQDIIQELQRKAKLTITVEGDLADFLGVHIDRRSYGTLHHLSQPHLIDQILDDLHMGGDGVKPRSTPAGASSKLLTRHSNSRPFNNSFNYRSVIGKLNYLEKATRSSSPLQCTNTLVSFRIPRLNMAKRFAGSEDTWKGQGTIMWLSTIAIQRGHNMVMS